MDSLEEFDAAINKIYNDIENLREDSRNLNHARTEFLRARIEESILSLGFQKVESEDPDFEAYARGDLKLERDVYCTTHLSVYFKGGYVGRPGFSGSTTLRYENPEDFEESLKEFFLDTKADMEEQVERSSNILDLCEEALKNFPQT